MRLLLAFTLFLGAGFARADQNSTVICDLILSKKTLHLWGVEEKDFSRLLEANDTGAVVQALAKLEQDLRSAPPQVFEILSLLSYARLGDEQMEHAVQKHLAKVPYMTELEITLGQEVKELARPLTNIYLAHRYTEGEARAWLKRSTASPYSALMLAQVLAHSPKPVATNVGDASRMNLNILRFRRMDGLDITLGPILRAYPILVLPYLKAMLPNLKITTDPNGRNMANLTKWLSDPGREALVEWAAAKMTGSKSKGNEDGTEGAETKKIPAQWKEFYKASAFGLNLPLNKWPRLKSRKATLGEVVWVSALNHVAADLFSSLKVNYSAKVDATIRSEEVHDHIRTLLTRAISKGLYTSNQAAFIVRHLVGVLGIDIESGPALKGRLSASLGKNLREMIRLAPKNSPAAPAVSDAVLMTEPGPELPAIFSVQESPPEAPVPLRDGRPNVADGALTIEDFIEEQIGIEDLKADLIYYVRFRRANDKFYGDQKFRFGPKLLKEILDPKADVHPLSWLWAIKMGLGRDYGERGLKILGSAECARIGICDDNAFKVKLLLSNNRIYGHIREGVWELESIGNEH